MPRANKISLPGPGVAPVDVYFRTKPDYIEGVWDDSIDQIPGIVKVVDDTRELLARFVGYAEFVDFPRRGGEAEVLAGSVLARNDIDVLLPAVQAEGVRIKRLVMEVVSVELVDRFAENELTELGEQVRIGAEVKQKVAGAIVNRVMTEYEYDLDK